MASDDVVERSPLFGSSIWTEDEEHGAVGAAWLEEQAAHPFIRDVGDRSLELLALESGQRVLEVGCGTGVFLSRLAAALGGAGSIVGLDVNPEFLAEARERLSNAGLTGFELIEGDAQHLPFEDASFDAAHCERVLMHLEDPDAAIREMRRVVRPGGRVVCSEVNANSAMVHSDDPETEHHVSRAVLAGIRNPSMGFSLRKRFMKAGLQDVTGHVVALFEESIEPDEVLEFKVKADELVADAKIGANRAAAFISGLRHDLAAGPYFGSALIVVVGGASPATDG